MNGDQPASEPKDFKAVKLAVPLLAVIHKHLREVWGHYRGKHCKRLTESARVGQT